MEEIFERLRSARERAGFTTASAAAHANGWRYPTYAGHENGSRGIKRPDLEKYADAFGVSASWLFSGKATTEKGKSTPKSTQIQHQTTLNFGLSEAPVAPYHAQTDTLRLQLIRLAESFSNQTKGTELFRVTRTHASLMLMAGDILIVDQRAASPAPGQICIAQIVDPETGDGHTALRLGTPFGIVSPFGEMQTPLGCDESILATVVASVRPPHQT